MGQYNTHRHCHHHQYLPDWPQVSTTFNGCRSLLRNIISILHDITHTLLSSHHQLTFSSSSVPAYKMPIISNGKTVLVTGGAGYIGSHCCVSLLEAGYEVVALDNFTNSVTGDKNESLALKRVEQITGQTIAFYKCDLLDIQAIEEIFQQVSLVDGCVPLSAAIHSCLQGNVSLTTLFNFPLTYLVML